MVTTANFSGIDVHVQKGIGMAAFVAIVTGAEATSAGPSPKRCLADPIRETRRLRSPSPRKSIWQKAPMAVSAGEVQQPSPEGEVAVFGEE